MYLLFSCFQNHLPHLQFYLLSDIRLLWFYGIAFGNSDRHSVLSWRLVGGVLSHTEEKKRAFALLRIGWDAYKQAGN